MLRSLIVASWVARNEAWLSAKRFALAVLVTACSLGVDSAHAAGLVFADDFESGGTSKWSQDGVRSMCTVVGAARDGGMPHGGTNMLECNWNGTAVWNGPDAYSTVMLPQNAWGYKSEFFIRIWVRYDKDVTHTMGGKILRLYPPDVLDDFFIVAQMNLPGGPAMVDWGMLSGKQGKVFWGEGTSLGDHSWHKIEVYMKASPGADGIARVWIDGTLRQNLTNRPTVAADHTWGPLYLMSNWSNNPGWEHGANNCVYLDDVEIYTDEGSGATGSMSDASIVGMPVPSAPNHVVVQ
jgi:hypothetical protein